MIKIMQKVPIITLKVTSNEKATMERIKQPGWKSSLGKIKQSGQENFGAKTQTKTSQDFGTKT